MSLGQEERTSLEHDVAEVMSDNMDERMDEDQRNSPYHHVH